MRLRHILEYEDHEIQDLLGNLETVGQSTKRTYSLWVEIPSFTYYAGYTNKLRVPIALGDPFWSTGTLLGDQEIILDSLSNGDFIRPTIQGQDWASLVSDNPFDPEDKHNLDRVSSRKAVAFLDKPSLQEFFKDQEEEGKTLGEALETLREKFMSIRYSSADYRPPGGGVALVYGEDKDPDLLIAPDASLYHATAYSEKVVLEDLTNGVNLVNPRIYLKDL